METGASDFAATRECCLREAFSTVIGTAAQLGAHRVAVILVESGSSIRVVCRWPDTETGDDLTGVLRACKEAAGARSATGRFVIPGAPSFLVLPWPEDSLKVAIALGFAPGEFWPADVPQEVSGRLRLTSLATWAEYEVQRLRRDLSVANERLGRRTVVERAKGLLQAAHGWSEQQAYEHLRRLSRQRRIRMAETAQDLVRML